ncbi:hypothetical protein A9Q89_03625 [Gammaproteobacteria bacterium 53_120_T64]|nr:hypothetical protein A9Q89_03625 [Gammaproteobacteria bacterium 53_120_T64]
MRRDVAIKPKDEKLIAFATSPAEEGLAVLRGRFVREARILAQLDDCTYIVNALGLLVQIFEGMA